MVAMWALELEKYANDENNNNNNKNINSVKRRRNNLLLSLCDDFGLCFQILDDVANLCDEALHAAKSFADDLDEGKFSYPAIHCILSGETKNPQKKDKRLLHALARKAESSTTTLVSKKSVAEKEFCLNLMKESGSIRASCDEVLGLCQLLRERVEQVVDLNNCEENEENQQEAEKCRRILLGLISKMSERAEKFSKF